MNFLHSFYIFFCRSIFPSSFTFSAFLEKIQNLEVYFCFLSTYYDRSRTDEKHIRICFTAAFNKHKDKGGNEHGESFIVPEAKGALDKFKFEVASELGVPLSDGYNGNLTSKQNGSVGGYMVKKMIEQQERQMSGGSSGQY